LPAGYGETLAEIKRRIQADRLRVVMAANSAMVRLYWDIGRTVLDRQEREGWGAKVIDRLSADLRAAYPDMTGLSPRNLKYMRAFAAAWPNLEFVQRVVARLPWRQNIALLERLGLRCFVVVELKAVAFEPGFVGQMNAYLSAVDDLLRHPHDKPTIGLLLCRSKERIVVEYALRDLNKPIGVAAWQTRIVDTLPAALKGSLPTVEEIEAELGPGRGSKA
jgi:predicted nuclease of restriction endonuclease-like (RecB) superfamily